MQLLVEGEGRTPLIDMYLGVTKESILDTRGKKVSSTYDTQRIGNPHIEESNSIHIFHSG